MAAVQRERPFVLGFGRTATLGRSFLDRTARLGLRVRIVVSRAGSDGRTERRRRQLRDGRKGRTRRMMRRWRW